MADRYKNTNFCAHLSCPDLATSCGTAQAGRRTKRQADTAAFKYAVVRVKVADEIKVRCKTCALQHVPAVQSLSSTAHRPGIRRTTLGHS